MTPASPRPPSTAAKTSRAPAGADTAAPWKIVLLPGDGIGAEVVPEALRVLRALEEGLPGLAFEFEEHAVGAGEYLKNGTPLPESAYRACSEADAVLLGAMGLPTVRYADGKEMTPQLDLRERLELYAGMRPIRLYHPQDSPLKGYGAGQIDFVIVRENCEGLFSARHSKRDANSDEVRDVLRVTRRGSERICRAAFDLARTRRRLCTLVDKANVLPSMVFLRSIFDEVARQYPDVRADRVYIDAMALYLVRQPEVFDVIVTENMFGDILSDLAAGLVGGMGMAPSGDIGDDWAVFQPSHGSAPDIAGRGIANPTATILSAAMMLDWLAHPLTIEGARRIRRAVQTVFERPENRTTDMGGTLKTAELTDLILATLS